MSNLLALQNNVQEFPPAQIVFDNSLLVPGSEIARYRRPPADTVFPLEYAFHLFGNIQGKTIVDLGFGEGLNTIILAGLGANVFSIDWSEKNLAATCRRACANGVRGNVTLLKSDRTTLPVRDNQADHVLCSSICPIDILALTFEITS